MVNRFTSRKFLVTVAVFVASIVSAVTGTDIAEEAELAGFLAPMLYLVVEGVLDWKGQ